MTSVMAHSAVLQWVHEMARLASPERVVWLNGSEQEYQGLVAEAVRTGQLIQLNQSAHPGCYLHRSHPSDVARVAYELYEQRGRTHGHELDDWLKAEHIVKQRNLHAARHGNPKRRQGGENPCGGCSS